MIFICITKIICCIFNIRTANLINIFEKKGLKEKYLHFLSTRDVN